MTIITEFAPAKINLYLHITGRRVDGYHDLDSLVTFADIGDSVMAEAAPAFSFTVTGPQSALLAHEPPEANLVVKAARSLAALVGKPLNVAITLNKVLPIASGIGGGSSDAAATLRALAKLWGLASDDPRIAEAASKHGQDVPACLRIASSYLTAQGLSPAPALPKTAVLLVNPNKALSTPESYKEFRTSNSAFSPLAQLDTPPAAVEDLVAALKARGNDLTSSSCWLMPEIKMILEEIAAVPDCLLARMSGSGATCFGLFKEKAAADAAAEIIRKNHPDWWVASGNTIA